MGLFFRLSICILQFKMLYYPLFTLLLYSVFDENLKLRKNHFNYLQSFLSKDSFFCCNDSKCDNAVHIYHINIYFDCLINKFVDWNNLRY